MIPHTYMHIHPHGQNGFNLQKISGVVEQINITLHSCLPRLRRPHKPEECLMFSSRDPFIALHNM